MSPLATRYAFLLVLLLLLMPDLLPAGEMLYSPYILSSQSQGDPVKTTIELKQALKSGGFQLIGEYSPNQFSHLIVITNGYLKRLAREKTGGLFLAAQRISITQVAGKLQVVYTNPDYFGRAYQLSGTLLRPVREQLRSILGEQTGFAPNGLSASRLAKYRYSIGMERFDDFLVLGRFNSQGSALRLFGRGLKRHQSTVKTLFRIDIPGANTSLFGLAIERGPGSDKAIIEAVDTGPIRHTAALPYTVVVRRGEIFALHPRFKLPLDFPDLDRTGRHSFTRIINVPEAIETALRGLLE